MNSLGATGSQDGVPLAEGDSGLLCAGGSEKGLKTLADRAASTIIVFHRPVLDLLAEAKHKSGYSTALTRTYINTAHMHNPMISCKLV